MHTCVNYLYAEGERFVMFNNWLTVTLTSRCVSVLTEFLHMGLSSSGCIPVFLLASAHIIDLSENSCGPVRMTIFPTKAKKKSQLRGDKKRDYFFWDLLTSIKVKKAKFLVFFASSLFLIHATLKPHSHGVKAHSINGNIFPPLQTFSNCGAKSRCRCSVETQVKNRHDGVSWCSYFLFLITVNNWS